MSGLILRRSPIWSFSGLIPWRSPISPSSAEPFWGFRFVILWTYPLEVSNSSLPGLILWRTPIRLFPNLTFADLQFDSFRTYPLEISNLWFFGLILKRSPHWPFSGHIHWRTPINLWADLSFGDLQFVFLRTYPLHLWRYWHVRPMSIRASCIFYYFFLFLSYFTMNVLRQPY